MGTDVLVPHRRYQKMYSDVLVSFGNIFALNLIFLRYENTVKPRLSRVIIYNDFQENIFYYNKLTYHIILL